MSKKKPRAALPKEVYTLRVTPDFKQLVAQKAKEAGKSEGEIVEACVMANYPKDVDLALAHKKSAVISILSRMEGALTEAIDGPDVQAIREMESIAKKIVENANKRATPESPETSTPPKDLGSIARDLVDKSARKAKQIVNG